MSERRIDSDLLDHLTVPARHDELGVGSRAWVRVDTSLRIYWHTLFDICPGLLRLEGEDGQLSDGMSIFRPFMAFAAERGLSFDWTYYLWVDVWLQGSGFRDRVDDDLRLTLIGAAAARWAVTDRSPAVGLVIGTRSADRGALPLVVGWKPADLESGREIETLELEDPLPDPATPFGWFTTTSRSLDHFPGWRDLPL
ncbi:methanobactin biosynthesis cassette protein MbnC [Tistrella mobilis]|uniref:methanobactin biosynthesis protein MbnC n=1 Tax=Tistrella mobilis TaxID=171437 RepID=UPI000AA14143|nr:methanobactin biosynthesis protein MbnC [Tistrella mobilis]